MHRPSLASSPQVGLCTGLNAGRKTLNRSGLWDNPGERTDGDTSSQALSSHKYAGGTPSHLAPLRPQMAITSKRRAAGGVFFRIMIYEDRTDGCITQLPSTLELRYLN